MLSQTGRQALSTSTFHGLPRVVTAKTRCMRLIWGLLIAAFTAICGVHIGKLLGKFYNEDLLSGINPRGAKFIFPDLYICHEVPIARSYFVQSMLERSAQTLQILRLVRTSSAAQAKIMASIGVSEAKANRYLASSKSFFFWETVNWSAFFALFGHRRHQTVMRVYFRNGELSYNHTQWRYQRGVHKYCFYITNPLHHSEKMRWKPTHMKLALYLDRLDDSKYITFVKSINAISPSHYGIRLYLVPQGTTPNGETDSLLIRPGYFYDMRVKSRTSQLYNSRSRPCYRPDLASRFVNPFSGRTASPHSDVFYSCLTLHRQRLLAAQCKCYVRQLSSGLVPEQIFTRYPPCFNLSHPVNRGSGNRWSRLKTRARCYIDFLTRSVHVAEKECQERIACEKTEYSTLWSHMKWPVDLSPEEVVEEYVLTPLRRRSVVSPWTEVPGWTEFTLLGNQSMTEKEVTIRRSLTEVMIQSQQSYSRLTEEQIAYPLSNLGSDIGGVMGLYLGLSILSFFELLEIIHDFGQVAMKRLSRSGSCGSGASKSKQQQPDLEKAGAYIIDLDIPTHSTGIADSDPREIPL